MDREFLPSREIRTQIDNVDKMVRQLNECKSCKDCKMVHELRSMLLEHRKELLESAVSSASPKKSPFLPDGIEYR